MAIFVLFIWGNSFSAFLQVNFQYVFLGSFISQCQSFTLKFRFNWTSFETVLSRFSTNSSQKAHLKFFLAKF